LQGLEDFGHSPKKTVITWFGKRPKLPYYRILAQFELEVTSKDHLVQPPRNERGHLQVDWVAQSPLRPGLELGTYLHIKRQLYSGQGPQPPSKAGRGMHSHFSPCARQRLLCQKCSFWIILHMSRDLKEREAQSRN